jgi:hypothetical protein
MTKGELETQAEYLILMNEKLRSHCLRQRTELCRLNKTLKAMWEGVRFENSCKMARHRLAVYQAAYKVVKYDCSDCDQDYQDAVDSLRKVIGA